METLYLVSKILVSILFFVTAFVMVYLCFKADKIKSECARIEKMCAEDIQKVYDTGSMLTKVLVELVVARYSLDLSKFTK